MPERVIIADTGPLVAFLSETDPQHDWAAAQFRVLPAPFLTCEPVLTETFHFLRRGGREGIDRYFRLLGSGVLRVDFDLLSERDAVAALVRKYHDLPMSLADACLIRVAERIDNGEIFTLDGRFRIYRKHGRRRIPAIMP